MASIEKPTVIVDVDGVCADFVGSVIDSIDHLLGPRTHAEIKTYDFMGQLPRVTRLFLDTECLVDASWWTHIAPIPLAQEGVASIREKGSRVLFASKPWIGCWGWCEARRVWLGNHFGVERGDIWFGDTKADLCGIRLIDDNPEQVSAYAKAHGPASALLFDAPYNRALDWDRRVTWKEAGIEYLRYTGA